MDPDGPFDGKAFVATLTTAPGVYRMYASGGELLYVGKAGNLRRRVGSYFLKPRLDPRIASMVGQIATVDVTVTRTEAEALLLEAQLIKAQKPRYNVVLRDDKSYPYIEITGGDFPRLAFHRGARSPDSRYFGPFPSAGAVRETLNVVHKLFRLRNCSDSFFRNRARPCLQYQIGRCTAPCVGLITKEEYAADVRHAALFLEGHSETVMAELVATMEAASKALEYERAARIRDRIAAIRKVRAHHYVHGAPTDMDVIACAADGGTTAIAVLSFRNGMSLGAHVHFPHNTARASGTAAVLSAFLAQYYLERPVPRELVLDREPEDAGPLADALSERAGQGVALRTRVRTERARFLAMARENARSALQAHLASRATIQARFDAVRDLLGLDMTPDIIECFDISHTQGEATVASSVAFGHDGPEKSRYRRFNISGITPGDDYAAMQQALQRRFRNVRPGAPGTDAPDSRQASLPDVLLIDGGRGQVARALDVLGELGIAGVPVVGVSKGPQRRAGEEVLVLGQSGSTLRPGPDSPALHLIDAVRDEAHRFAITGHRGRRARARTSGGLQEISGVGPRRRADLLRHFGGLAGVTAAGVEELMRVRGINRELALRIYAALHG